MRKKKTYNRDNCSNMLRATITDKLGRTISLFGKYAFEWQIVIESKDKITITSFSKSIDARKEFNKYKRKR